MTRLCLNSEPFFDGILAVVNGHSAYMCETKKDVLYSFHIDTLSYINGSVIAVGIIDDSCFGKVKEDASDAAQENALTEVCHFLFFTLFIS